MRDVTPHWLASQSPYPSPPGLTPSISFALSCSMSPSLSYGDIFSEQLTGDKIIEHQQPGIGRVDEIGLLVYAFGSAKKGGKSGENIVFS
jgi:hypothetical protein